MPTKAELEFELAVLKQQLADVQNDAASEAPNDLDSPEGEADIAAENNSEDVEYSGHDIHSLVKQVTKELDNLAEHRPLVTMLGVFVVGFVLGKIR